MKDTSKYSAKLPKKELLFTASFEEEEKSTGSFLQNTPDPKFQAEGIESENGNIMTTRIGTGPSYTWMDQPNKGLTGQKTLNAEGKVLGLGIAKARNIIFDNLNIPVTADTYLQYAIFPSMSTDHYDFDFTQMYLALDLGFTDGTTMSELGVLDRNGNLIEASEQGRTKTLFTHQWNLVTGKIGEKAQGKVIEKIYVTYNKPVECKYNVREFVTFFDDIKIYNSKEFVRTNLVDYVNTLCGTNDSPGFSRGLTSPSTTLPHGFNMWAPSTNPKSSKLYDYYKNRFSAMTITHEPSIWIGDRGTWQFVPNTALNAASVSEFGVLSAKNFFSHDNEVARPHYYSVDFKKNGGDAAYSGLELTPTMHGAIVRFTFAPEAPNRSIMFDSICDKGGVEYLDDGSFTAYTEHKSHGSAKMYIYGRFSEIPTDTAICESAGLATFSSDEVVMKLATSYISPEAAKHNFELELENKTFDDVCFEAIRQWNEVLSIFSDIKGAREAQLESIYTGLYYLYKYPNLMSENVGTNEAPVYKYRSPYSGEIENGIIYINNGFWDTYRTVWPGYHLFTPNKSTGLLNGMVRHYTDSGWVPRWIAPGGVNCMVGTSSDIIFADGFAKDIEFDRVNAYDSALRNASVFALEPRKGGRQRLDSSPFLGYTPGSHEDFSWSMEGYINDFGIAEMAKQLAAEETDPEKKAKYIAEYKYFKGRSQNYPLLFWKEGDTTDKMWFRGRERDGKFTHANDTDGKFDPLFWGRDFTETDAYNMSVSVPHDGEGLVHLYGSSEALEEKIDSIFTVCAPYKGYGSTCEHDGIHEQREAREMKLGRYGHNNQPSHHIAYMYNFTDTPSKAQKYARDIMDRLYVGTDFGQGMPGDEDNGEMSCWLLFSSLGFYPLAVGRNEYAIGSPLFSEVTLNMDNGKKLRVVANNNSKENIYVKSMTINGKPHNSVVIKHEDICDGGEIVFEMSDKPSLWGSEGKPASVASSNRPPMPLVDIIPASGEGVTSTIADVNNLFDNTSLTFATVNAGDTITFTPNGEFEVELFTLTSAKEGTAPEATLYGVDKNGEKTVLAKTDSIGFRWPQYTRPFLVSNTTPFASYVVEFTSDGTVSEVELLTHMEREAAQTYLGIEH